MDQKLFAVMLGGRAPRANTELHDVVFVTGARIEDTYDQLLDKWFGSPEGLHIDSWVELDVIDGWRVTLTDSKPAGTGEQLFFVNLGAYQPGSFVELHATGFYVTTNAAQAKDRARAALFRENGLAQVHKDDLHAVDDCLAIDGVDGLHVTLTWTGETSQEIPQDGYHLIPKPVVAAWAAAKITQD